MATKKATKKVAKKAVKKTAVKKATPAAPKKGAYKIVVETGGETYKAQSDDIAAAVRGFGIKYTNTKIHITVSKGKKELSKSYFRGQGLRILKNEMAARFFARNAEKILG